MRKRLLSAVTVSVLAAASVAAAVSASPDSTSVFHFSGRAGSAILTDCIGVPVGGRCRAVDVFAFEQRVNENGQRSGGPGIDVVVFAVEIIAQSPGFVAVPVAFGFTDQATVRIDRNLSAGSAAATVPLGPLGTVSVTVEWDGDGPISRVRTHDTFSNTDVFANDRSRGAMRDADASGTLDGTPVDDIPLFPSSLQTDAFGSVFRIASPMTASAIAGAADVSRSSQHSASGAVTDCPPGAPVGTVCNGALVSVESLQDGRLGPIESRVFVDFYRLTVAPDGGLIPEFVGFGTDFDPQVTFDARLGGATVVADLDRFVCDDFGCVPAGITTAFTARWDAAGDAEHFRQHSQFAGGGTKTNVIVNGRLRPATLSATVDGAPYAQVPGFTSSMREADVHANML